MRPRFILLIMRTINYSKKGNKLTSSKTLPTLAVTKRNGTYSVSMVRCFFFLLNHVRCPFAKFRCFFYVQITALLLFRFNKPIETRLKLIIIDLKSVAWFHLSFQTENYNSRFISISLIAKVILSTLLLRSFVAGWHRGLN